MNDMQQAQEALGSAYELLKEVRTFFECHIVEWCEDKAKEYHCANILPFLQLEKLIGDYIDTVKPK